MITNGRSTNGIIDPAHIPAKRRAVMKLCPACGLNQSGGRWACEDSKCGYVFRTKKAPRKPKASVPIATIEHLIQPAQTAPPVITPQVDDPIETAVRSLVDAIKSSLVDDKPTDSIHVDIKALREENRQLRADIAALADSVKYFRIFITDTLGLKSPRHDPFPQLENTRPSRKSIAIIGLLPDQQNRVKEVLEDRANLIFLDSDKRRDFPKVDYAISSRHSDHGMRYQAESVVGIKNFKFLPTTNVQDVIKTVMDFLSRQ